VRELRLEAGRHLVMTTKLTIDAIAGRVGFPDRFHFARCFRQQYGAAPRSVRAR